MPLIATRAAASSRGFGQQQGGGLSPYVPGYYVWLLSSAARASMDYWYVHLSRAHG